MPAEQNTELMLSIVVVGAMNPQIHHPYWYRIANILTEGEVAEAIKQPVAVSPDLSVFSTGDLRISCTRERWEIVVSRPDLRPRMAAIVTSVFDDKLKETPISLLAFNYDSRQLVHANEDVERLLASHGAAAWGLAKFGPVGATATFTIKSPDRGAVEIRIEPATDHRGVVVPGKVFLAVNSNHPIQYSSGYFELKRLLDDRFDSDYEEAQSYVKAILASLLGKAE